MNIGIEEHTKLVYEASNTYGHPVWPSPVMLQVVVTSEDAKSFEAAKMSALKPNSILFREETYNSSSRVRRGRLYKAGSSQPVQWQVYPHPAIASEVRKADINGGTLSKQVSAFSSFRLKPHLQSLNLQRPLFLLGAEGGFTIWTLINTEVSATGEELVVLRARKSVGALPHLDREKVLNVGGKKVLDLVNKLEEELYRASPESIVDRSREAATSMLSVYLQNEKSVTPGRDLAYLAGKMVEHKCEVVANAAKIIARLHARGKHAEQEKRATRSVNEQDAELAVQLVGAILCDLQWATW